ncbi:hypothetical protein KHQ81_01955 [Mycoplasmatota bacterium]|nr:hypothetical protein KHQ81_01955 [Mycoplasmatota bacterium]
MSNGEIILLIFIVLILLYFINRERKQRILIKNTLVSLEEILEGNKNLKILVGKNELVAPLIFKINQLVESYQIDQIEMKKTIQDRKELMSNLSHDVRTPLTSILGYLDAICDGIAGDETLEYIHIVKDKAYALKDYIDELFMIAQLDANEIQFKIEQIDILTH